MDGVKILYKIYAGQEKYTDHQVVITTWQSVYKEPRKWFDRFDVVIGDEAPVQSEISDFSDD